ncbi:MAG: beta-lactamase family protein [Frankiaceae bacterium]|nr:beta-lactamase family protein [Frankiaceae bacterium]
MTAGVQDERLAALLGRAAREVDAGRLPSCQLAVARKGELLNVTTLGAATDDSRYLTFSVTKSLVAAAVWVAIADEALGPATRVCEHVPSFARPGFDAVTLEHLLTHTAGFPRAPLPPLEGATSQGRAAWFEKWRLEWEPGTRTEYSPTAGHWVVAELLEQATGTDYRTFVAERVLAPLGLHRLRLGVPIEDQRDVVDTVGVGADEEADDRAPVVVTLSGLLEMDRPDVRAVGVPGAGAVSTAADIALLYQAFLHNPGGLWDPAVLADATGRIRNALPDPWTKVAANRSLGLVIAGDDGNAAMRDALGRSVGPRAFGASGASGQVAWADPESGLSFCYLTNGLEADQVRSFMRSSSMSTLAGRLLLESAS